MTTNDKTIETVFKVPKNPINLCIDIVFIPKKFQLF